jgi:mono/diheme cytochrome c family protein
MKRETSDARTTFLVPVARFAFRVSCFAFLLLSSCKHDDMADQVKLKPYARSEFYANQASARPLVPHTLAIDDDVETPLLDIPAGLNILGRWQNPLPADASFPFPITATDLRRGQERFTIFCTPCHGQTGDGNGMIPQRGFTRPPTYHSDRLRNAPVSYFYNVITGGLGAMYPYNDRIPPDDRWRIIAYIRALQLSQYAPLATLSPDDQKQVAEARHD